MDFSIKFKQTDGKELGTFFPRLHRGQKARSRKKKWKHEAKKNVNVHVQASTNFPPNALNFHQISTLSLWEKIDKVDLARKFARNLHLHESWAIQKKVLLC